MGPFGRASKFVQGELLTAGDRAESELETDSMFSKKVLMLAAAGVAAVVIVGVALASTASNTVSTSKAGEGSGSITGYDISTVHYNLNPTDPTKIDGVTFKLDTAPTVGSTIRVALTSTSTTWYTCTFVTTNATCLTTVPQATVGPSDALKVVVAQ